MNQIQTLQVWSGEKKEATLPDPFRSRSDELTGQLGVRSRMFDYTSSLDTTWSQIVTSRITCLTLDS